MKFTSWFDKYSSIIDGNIRHLQKFRFDIQSCLNNPQKIPNQMRNVCDFLIEIYKLTENVIVREKSVQFFLFFLSTFEAKLKIDLKVGIVPLINCIDFVIQVLCVQLPELIEIMHKKLDGYIDLFAQFKNEYKSFDLFRIFTNPNIISRLN